MIHKINKVIFQHRIIRLIRLIEKECVSCAVRREFISILEIKFLVRRARHGSVDYKKLFLAFQRGGWAPSQSSPCEFCGE